MTTTIPPFAPTLDAERETAALLLSQGERKRTGHMFKDCPALDIIAPGKAKGCKPCLARWQEVGQLARVHQQRYDAAWYAQAAAADPAPAPAPVAEDEWLPVSNVLQRSDDGYSMPKIDAAEAWVPATHREAITNKPKANRYGGRCPRCSQWVEAGEGALCKLPDGKWGAQHLDGQCPAPKAQAAPTATADRASEPGIYVRLSDSRLVRVAVSRTSGKPYALLCTLDEYGEDEYLGGGRHLEGLRKATLEEVQAYGRATIRCCVCSTRLENPESRALGIGPICRSKAF